MSKMNELSIDHDSYELYIEEGNNELRREGAEELRIEILRALIEQKSKAATAQEKFGLDTAIVVVTQAQI